MDWCFGDIRWRFDGCATARVMGILNATPDSFSDGGRFAAPDAAVAHGLDLLAAGAALVDLGGESTRPGAEPVAAEEEIRRVLPVVSALAARGAVVSIDTSKPEVAAAALRAGACIVNDITALGDPDMAEVVRNARAGLVLMHMRGTPRTMQTGDLGAVDIAGLVCDFLAERLERALAAGLPREAIVLDAGIGFGKTAEQNIALLASLPRLRRLGRPVLLGISRKSVLGAVTGRGVAEREAATAAAHALGVSRGADILRAHDVAAARDAIALAAAVAAAEAGGAA